MQHPLKFTVDLYADQLEEVMAHLKLDEQPALLAGHSAGGAMSLRFAKRHPELVRGLLLIAPVVRNNTPAKWLASKLQGSDTFGSGGCWRNCWEGCGGVWKILLEW